MGTNFYWIASGDVETPVGVVAIDSSDPVIHIGKRSAAGRYCWTHDVTLMAGGKAMIHTGRGVWLDHCPIGGEPWEEPDDRWAGAGAVELGFAVPAKTRPSGLGSAASFSWAQDPERVRAICRDRSGDTLVIDEYGDQLTGAEFLAMLEANCPIEFTDHIGRAFS